MPLRVGNAAGFLGDRLSAPRRMAESGQVDCLTLEYLAELTMSILARLRQRDPQAGYAADFLEVLADLANALKANPRLTIVTNAGGVNPLACAVAAGRILGKSGLAELPVAAVTGDDLLAQLPALTEAGHTFPHFDTGQPLADAKLRPVSANAYLGAAPLVEALAGGARVVISGRVADASLTVAPAVHAFGWEFDQLDRLAGASVAGHVIECGAQATGGYLALPTVPDLVDVGYPIAELEPDGSAVITKHEPSGGVVNRLTVAAQLVYEIGNPRYYLTPDVDVDFTSVRLEELGTNRVRLSGTRGGSPPNTLKVSLAYEDGYTAAGTLLVAGRGCVSRARETAEVVRRRLAHDGAEPARYHVELLGRGDGTCGVLGQHDDIPEVMLRIAVQDLDRRKVERFARELAPLITSGPPGLAGYAAGRPQIRPMFAYWPTTIDRTAVTPQVFLRTAAQWSET